MKPAVYEKTLSIPYYLCDRYGRINLPYLVNILIEVSGEQTDKVSKVSVEELNLHWIIIQYNIDINRLPNADESITVRTTTKEHNRLFSYREFEVYDKDHNLIVSAVTVFALINDDRKLTKIPKEVIKGYGSTENRRIRRMPKPEIPRDLSKVNRKDYNVRYFDIDTNFHANNSMYFIWTLDALSDEFLATHDLMHVNITYDKEVNIGDVVESYSDFTVDGNEQLFSRHVVKVDDVVKCSATFKWKENNIVYQRAE